MAEIYDTQICRYDGKNCFFEVVTSAFTIGKVLFNFSQYDPNRKNKEIMRLEIYLDFSDALALSRMIINNRLMMIMCNAAREGSYEGKPVNDYTSYFSCIGGTVLDKNRNRNRYEKIKAVFPGINEVNGQIIINKQFKVQKSNKYFIMVRGEYANGEIVGNGLISPKGKPLAGISVSLTEVQAIGMAEQIRIAIEAFKNQFYNKYCSQLFPDQTCKVYQYERSVGDETLKEDTVKAIEIVLCSDLIKVNEELQCIRASYNNREFILYIPNSRMKRTDLRAGNRVCVEYEVFEKEGKKYCYFVR